MIIRAILVAFSLAALTSCTTPTPIADTAVKDELRQQEFLSADDLRVAVDAIRDDLNLTDEQARLVLEATDRNTAEFRALINASHEAEPDPDELVRLLAEARENFDTDLAEVLTEEQWVLVEEHDGALREAILTAAAARRVQIMEPTLGITSEQSAQLAAVVGQAAADLVAVLNRYQGRHIGMMQKLELARAFLSIKSNSEKQIKTILTPEQLDRYNALIKELAKK